MEVCEAGAGGNGHLDSEYSGQKGTGMGLDLEHLSRLSRLKCSESEPIAKMKKSCANGCRAHGHIREK